MTSELPYDQRLARLLVRPFCGSVVSPNAITAASLVIGAAAALCYALGGPIVHVGAILFVVAFFLDHMDGELARMSERTSRFGHYFDLAAGGLVLVLLFAGIGIGLGPAALGGHAALLGVIAGAAIALIFALRLELERREGKQATRQPRFMGFEIEDVLYLVAPITWLGGLEPFLLLAAIGSPIYLLHVIWICRRLFHDRPV